MAELSAAAAPPPQPGVIGAGGMSASIRGQRSRVKAILNQWLEKHEVFQGAWDSVSVEQVCSKQFWEQFAYWLVNEYKKKADGTPLSDSTVYDYLGTAMNVVFSRFENAASIPTAATAFFKCLNSSENNPQWKWWAGVKSNAKSRAFAKLVEEGVEMDKSAPAVYFESDGWKMVRAYCLAGTPEVRDGGGKRREMGGGKGVRVEANGENYSLHAPACQAADRRFGIVCAYWAAGRGGELKGTTYANQSFDPLFKQVVQKFPMLKVTTSVPAAAHTPASPSS